MKAFIAILLIVNFNIHASVNELFGPSSGSMALGNQAEKDSAANNMISPALLGFSKSTQFSFNFFYISSKLHSIKNVLLENEMNSANDPRFGNIDVNRTPDLMFSLHYSSPMFTPEGLKFNFSLISPTDRMLEFETGGTYEPRYVMYGSRYFRPSIHFSLSKSFSDWSYGLGVITGFQSNGNTQFLTRFGNTGQSAGKISFNAKPSLAFAFSLAKKQNESFIHFISFQQEMKSNFQNRAVGETDIGTPDPFIFDFTMKSLLSYDPHTIRYGLQSHHEKCSFYGGLEYQHWASFKTSTIDIDVLGGNMGSSIDYEKIEVRNILIPKAGMIFSINDQINFKLGYFYKPSILNTKKLAEAGNSIDSNKHVPTSGINYNFKLFGTVIAWDTAYQAHLLEIKKIIKTPGREDGDTSEGEGKIGSPGYRIGGIVHVLSTGVSWKY